MIKKLKYKVLATIMFFVTIIIVAFVCTVTFVPAKQNDKQAEAFLRLTAKLSKTADMSRASEGGEKDFQKPSSHSEEPFPENGEPMIKPFPVNDRNPFMFANMITAILDSSGNVISWFSHRSDLYDEEYIQDAAEQLLESSKEFGKFDSQYYLLLKSADSSEDTYTLLLLDNSVGFASMKRFFILSTASGVTVWVVLLLLAIFLVDKMTHPVSAAFEKQRRFIADAGHELKTPISVISANASVLKSEVGENKWLSYINTETRRMELLVKDLMSLASIEDRENTSQHLDFDLSNAVLTSALPFESLAFEKGIMIEFDVTENLHICGNRSRIEQLVTILLSNAVKYGRQQGLIRLSLTHEQKKAVLRIYNTGQGIEPDEKDRIFDRFYRADKARSRESGSFGLGLAIAKAITEEHNAHISVENRYGEWIEFTVTFPALHQH